MEKEGIIVKYKQYVLALACTVMTPFAASAMTSTNVPVDSVYYTYIDKLSGMGYIQSMPNGAKPYSRLEVAKWVLEAKDKAAEKPMPDYLASQLDALEAYVAPEIAMLQGDAAQNDVTLRDVTVEGTYNNADALQYPYKSVHGSWQPFGANRNGYRYGRDGSVSASMEISGNIGHDTAVSLRPRLGYTTDDKGTASLEEGYVKTRFGSLEVEAGRQAMIWGQGASGNLLLGNNMKPLTALQVHLNEPKKVGGFMRFLGDVDFHSFYGILDGDRKADAASMGRTDFDDPGLLGLRVDITPTDYATFGISRISLLGGKGNSLSRSDWGDWLTGTNAYTNDKWDDIGGFDFRLRFPGVQWYGELYGEDQAGYLPSKVAYRLGAYFPRLTSDGMWDMTVEAAKTSDVWYRHGTFQDGWTYSGDIMGDPMGTDALKYYGSVKRYLPYEGYLGAYYMRTEMERSTPGHPVVDEAALMGQQKVGDNVYLKGTLGLARVQNGAGSGQTDYAKFATAAFQWRY